MLKLGYNFGFTNEEIFELSKIDPWFLYQFEELYLLEKRFKAEGRKIILEMKKAGFSNRQLAFLTKESEILSHIRSGAAIDITKAKVESILKAEEESIEAYLNEKAIQPVYKRIDTCAGEFEAFTPYMYSSYDEEDESNVTSKKKVMILGSGPNRIGQGIEFDYCCCHASFALQDSGVESIMVNSNPETVSTDYDTSTGFILNHSV